MNTIPLALLTIALSALPLLALALGDPKRLRSLRLRKPPTGRGPRQILAGACLLPGLLLALFGAWPAFLIWIGGLSFAAWLLVQGLAASRPRTPAGEG